MSPLNPIFSDLKGKNVWIIGASSGIGEACAKLFSSRGANLVISARRKDALQRIQSLCQRSDPDPSAIHIIPIDVNDEHSVMEATAATLQHWQKIDLLLFVSGIYEPMRASTFSYQQAYKTINTNLLGLMRVLDGALPQFLKQGKGHIAIVSSVAGYSGLPKSLSYGPSKAALINFAESLYYDLAPQNIGVHLISPGFVATPAVAVNDFEMPALISPEEAAIQIVRGLERGEFEIHFPKRFTYLLKVFRLLPYSIYFWALNRLVKI